MNSKQKSKTPTKKKNKRESDKENSSTKKKQSKTTLTLEGELVAFNPTKEDFCLQKNGNVMDIYKEIGDKFCNGSVRKKIRKNFYEIF